jgi:quinone-modifying oxidoreductase subunit QmoA
MPNGRIGEVNTQSDRNGHDAILVIGGGIAGITAAVEAAEVGHRVILVEREATLGGRVMRLHQYFPKLCPPSCGMEVNFRRIRTNPRIEVLTGAEVQKIEGERGAYTATIRVNPRYVTGEQPLSAAHFEAVTSEVPDPFNLGKVKVKALHTPHDMAYPPLHVLDKDALGEDELTALAAAEPKGAIDLDQQPETREVAAGAVIIATGWRPYDATNLDVLGYNGSEDVIANVELERLASVTGPTGGKIQRPSDGGEPQRVAFVQCAGSRDVNNLPYCSAVCCMGSLKQARYVREQLPEAEVTIFYIDIRTIGRHEEFYYELLDDEKVRFVKGKVAKVNTGGDGLELQVEDTVGGKLLHETFDLVVLATGVVPNTVDGPIPGAEVETDEYGFIVPGTERNGIYAVGCARRPTEVSRSVKDATAAALKAIQDVRR